MPDGQPPRRPVPARPVTPPDGPTRAKPVVAKPVPGTRPPAPPTAETVVARKTVVTPKVPAKPRVAVVADDDIDDRPVTKSPARADDGKPGKKVRFSKEDRRRIREEKAAEEVEERRKALQEWVFPGILAGLGALLTVVAAFYHSTSSADHAVGAGVMILVSAVYAVVMIPVTILILMVIGKLCGIEYGSLGTATRNLGGILGLLVGVYWTGSLFGWMGLFLTPTLASLVTFVLFMKVFDLDVAEARMTAGAMNFLTFIGNVMFQTLVISQILLGGHGRHPGTDSADEPDFNDPPPGLVEPADDFGPDPKGKGKAKPAVIDDLNGDP